MYWIYVVGSGIAVYGLMVYAAISITKEKLNVSNNILGTGIATMILGFVCNASLVLKFIDAGGNWRDNLSFLYAVLSVICLLIGLAGIVMMAVGILKECKDE